MRLVKSICKLILAVFIYVSETMAWVEYRKRLYTNLICILFAVTFGVAVLGSFVLITVAEETLVINYMINSFIASGAFASIFIVFVNVLFSIYVLLTTVAVLIRIAVLKFTGKDLYLKAMEDDVHSLKEEISFIKRLRGIEPEAEEPDR